MKEIEKLIIYRTSDSLTIEDIQKIIELLQRFTSYTPRMLEETIACLRKGNKVEIYMTGTDKHKSLEIIDLFMADLRKLGIATNICYVESECKYKPFNLKAAKAGKPVCTRDGRKARIICFDFQSIENTPIVAAVQVTDKQEVITNYYEDGRQFVDGISELDLMMLSEKKEGWVNVYNLDNIYRRVYSSKEEAEKQKDINCVATIKIEWEE